MLPQTRGQLHFLMAGIIVPDESADESDHDQWRRLFSDRASRRVRGYRHGHKRTCLTTTQQKNRKGKDPVGKPA